MKTRCPLFPLLAAGWAAYFALTVSTSAQVTAQDDAAGYTNAPGGANYAWLYNTTTNGGFGFNPWVFQRGGSGFQGFFVGTGDAIASSSNTAWGMYANGGNGDNVAVAFRGLSSPLAINKVFKIKWHNTGIGFSTANRGGFSLRNGNANATTNDFDTGARFDFYYIGGGQDSFVFADNSGVTATGLGFGTGPMQIQLILLTADTYRLLIKDPTGTTTLATFDNQTLGGTAGSSINSLALYALQTSGDQIFNSLEVSSTSLLPPDINNVFPANGAFYVDASATNVSFEVDSAFSTVSSNGTSLFLNGVKQTNVVFNTTAPTQQLLATNKAHLATNVIYSAMIIAVDGNGNRVTNNFTFNTWSAKNPFIEGEDYNYSSGHYIDNFANQPPQDHNLYSGLFGSNGVDYLESDLSGTNSAWRPGDLPQTEAATDADHNLFSDNGFQDYNLSFVKNGEWQNYTRRMSNTTYAVYARMAGFGNNAVMLLEHLANATATSSNQPRASLGTFVCPNTGGAQNWTFVQLKDFSSSNVLVNFTGTNTFRCTCIGDDQNYNLNYLLFVPSTNTATLRPYIASGYPFPGAGGVPPDQKISFTIANRQTAVVPGSIQLLLDGTNVTSGIALSNNTAGTVVSYQSPTLLMLNSAHTLRAVFGDGSVTQTNDWSFNVENLLTIPGSYAINLPGGSNGFAVHIVKARNDAPVADFPASSTRAEAHLAGVIIDPNTGQPYVNEAAGPNGDGLYAELNVINYEQCGMPSQDGDTFTNNVAFPYVDLSPYAALGCSNTNGPDYISMAINTLIHLQPGIYRWAVRSDDGFRLTTGTGSTPTNTLVMDYEGGRSSANPSVFEFIIQQAGFYPFRLLYYEGQFGASIEWYSINRTTGEAILINDPANVNALKAYLPGVLLVNAAHSGHTSTFRFQTQAGRSYRVQYKNALNDALWQTLQTVAGNGSVTNIMDNAANGASRFYRVVTQ